jgi:hypothetical protein
MEEFDLSKELQEFYEKNKHDKKIANWKETLKKTKGFFSLPDFSKINVEGDDIEIKIGRVFTSVHIQEDFIFSLGKNNIFYYKKFLLFTEYPLSDDGSPKKPRWLKVNYSNIGNLNIEYKEIVGDAYPFYKFNGFKGIPIIKEVQLFKEIHTLIEVPFNELKRLKKEQEQLKEQEQQRIEQLKEQQRIENLNESQTNILKELDKDGNGEVDVVEGNDFNLLLKKHQKSIIEIDRTYVQQFVKVSSYLKTKKNNVQLIFNSIKDTSNEEELNEYVGILKNEIHSYSLILFNSLNMIVSLVEDDMITFYEIHESFDKLNIFNSNWENEVSQKLSNIGNELRNIGNGLSNLMYSIEEMGQNIVNEIGHLSYVTEESNQMLSNQLQDIDSSLQTNNLLTGIQTYQMYKINKNTKGLRE